MQAVILAAGRGTRLHPITLKRSKAMLPVLGKPIVARIVEALALNAVRNLILVVSPLDQEIKSYFRQQSIPGIEILFVEQPEPKGMANALSYVEPYIREDFFLSACDSLLPTEDYARLITSWKEGQKSAALLALQQVNPEQARQTAIVQINNGVITQIIEKPAPHQVTSNIASLPIYLFNKSIFSQFPKLKPSLRGELELQDAIQALIKDQNQVRGEFVSSRMNLTSAQDLLEINLHFLKSERPQILLQDVQLGTKVNLKPPYFIGSRTVVKDYVTLGPYVYAESNLLFGEGSRVSNSVLLRGARVEEGQFLEHTIIFPEPANFS